MTDDASIVRIYLDSNVFIYFFEGESEESNAARQLLFAARNRRGLFVTSEITLAEVLARASERAPLTSALHRKYLNLIAWNEALDLRPVTRDILLRSAEQRRFTRHKLPDAVHFGTAVDSGCRYLVSRDRQMKRVPADMEWVDVTEAGVRGLLEVIDVAE